MTSPYKEWVAGFNGWLEAKLPFKQFAGSISVSPLEVAAGQPFDLTIEFQAVVDKQVQIVWK